MQLPPLNALKAFVAAARHGGYVAAGRELGVTPAAISQQVRALEAHFGRSLFVRHNNRIVLTDSGQGLFAGLAPSFEQMEAVCAAVATGRSRKRLVISAIGSFAECWLLPRLEPFLLAFPDLRIDLRVEDDPVDFAGAHIDVRLAYGPLRDPALVEQPLLSDHVVPLCSRSFREAYGPAANVQTLADDHFIHTSWGPSFTTNPRWGDWFAAFAPGRQIDEAAGHRVGMSKLALDLALAGRGVALGQYHLAQQALAAGDLVMLSAHSLPLAKPYVLAVPQAKVKKESVAQFTAWMLAQASLPSN